MSIDHPHHTYHDDATVDDLHVGSTVSPDSQADRSRVFHAALQLAIRVRPASSGHSEAGSKVRRYLLRRELTHYLHDDAEIDIIEFGDLLADLHQVILDAAFDHGIDLTREITEAQQSGSSG